MVWLRTMINFQNETQNLAKSTHFGKFIFIQQWLMQNMCFIGANTCIFNNVAKDFIQKKILWKSKKGLKKIHNRFVIPLAHLCVFSPTQ